MKSLFWLVLSFFLSLAHFGFAQEEATPTASSGPATVSVSKNNLYLWKHPDAFEWTAALFHASVRAGLEVELGGGLVLSSSNQLSKGYWGYAASCLMGWKLTDSFSLSIGVDGGGFKNTNSALTGGADFNDNNLVLLGKYRFATND